MHKCLLGVFLGMAMLLAGCTGNQQGKIDTTKETKQVETQVQETNIVEETELKEESTIDATTNEVKEITREEQNRQALEGLEPNQYEDLKISVFLPLRKLTLPGDTIRLDVVVENTGDKRVYYPHGSGSRTNPDALLFQVEGLQEILSKDQLGMNTLDMQTRTIEPGESKTFTIFVRGIKKNPSFDEKTRQLYQKDQTYIADLSFEELQKLYPELQVAAGGNYEGKVFFLYGIEDEDKKEQVILGPTSYATGDIAITIQE